jgi:hypothetical protein
VFRLVSTVFKPLFRRAQRSGTSTEDISRASWIHVQCNYITSEITPCHTLLWNCPRSLRSCSHQPSSANPRRSRSRHPSHFTPPFFTTPPSPLTPSPFTSAVYSAALHPSFRRTSTITPAHLTGACHSAARHCRLYSAALDLSFRLSSPLIPPLFTHTLQCAAFHPPPRPSVIPAHHYAALHPSTRRHQLPPFTPPPFTAALHSAALHPHPPFRRTVDLPSTSSSSFNRARTGTRIFSSWSCSCHPLSH